jgi:intracellular sulfur oxidation DsrE/DsrF family protein
MKRHLIPVLLASTLCACAGMPSAQESATPAAAGAQPNSAAALAGMKEMKMAFDVIDGAPGPLMLKLNTIDLTRKQLIEAGVTPHIVIAFRGEASYYTQTDLSKVKENDRADALKIRAKIKELSKSSGVDKLEQCNVPLASRKIKPADVMEEVKVVGNGWISLAAHQARGYAYIAP